MTKFDREYLELCRKILEKGTLLKDTRSGATHKIPNWHFTFDLEEEFPILTTKQVYIRQAILEMLWIYQVQSNEVKWLQDRNVHIWDEWEVQKDGYWYGNGYEKDQQGRKFIGEEYAGTIGTAYGYVVRKYKQMDRLIYKLKNLPNMRDKIISLWQEECLETASLKPCVWSSEWDVTNGKLNASIHQRSCDVPLGLPFNVTQYAVLTHMLAQVCDLKVGTIDWSIQNAQIYENQVDGIKEQLRRYNEMGDHPAPQLWINPEVTNFYDFDHSEHQTDVKVLNYKHNGPIIMPISR